MPQFEPRERELVLRILAHPCLQRWYAENLDESIHPKLSPIPLGLVFRDGYPDGGIVIPHVPRLLGRPLRVFCAHRHREGPQWLLRRRVSDLAEGEWRTFSTVPASEMSETAFMAEVERHAFVLCAEGGGLDPSPKAWSALLYGAIPIIRNTALTPAYAHLPVVVVDDWRAGALSAVKLERWRESLLPWFDEPARRQEVLHRLSVDYWWQVIAAGRAIEDAAPLAILPQLHPQSHYHDL